MLQLLIIMNYSRWIIGFLSVNCIFIRYFWHWTRPTQDGEFCDPTRPDPTQPIHMDGPDYVQLWHAAPCHFRCSVDTVLICGMPTLRFSCRFQFGVRVYSIRLALVVVVVVNRGVTGSSLRQGLYILIDRPGSRHRHLAIRTLYYTSSSVLLSCKICFNVLNYVFFTYF